MPPGLPAQPIAASLGFHVVSCHAVCMRHGRDYVVDGSRPLWMLLVHAQGGGFFVALVTSFCLRSNSKPPWISLRSKLEAVLELGGWKKMA